MARNGLSTRQTRRILTTEMAPELKIMTSLFPGFKQISLLIRDAPEEEGNQRHGNDHDVEQVKC